MFKLPPGNVCSSVSPSVGAGLLKWKLLEGNGRHRDYSWINGTVSSYAPAPELHVSLFPGFLPWRLSYSRKVYTNARPTRKSARLWKRLSFSTGSSFLASYSFQPQPSDTMSLTFLICIAKENPRLQSCTHLQSLFPVRAKPRVP